MLVVPQLTEIKFNATFFGDIQDMRYSEPSSERPWDCISFPDQSDSARASTKVPYRRAAECKRLSVQPNRFLVAGRKSFFLPSFVTH